jgi:hypothetical protein
VPILSASAKLSGRALWLSRFDRLTNHESPFTNHVLASHPFDALSLAQDRPLTFHFSPFTNHFSQPTAASGASHRGVFRFMIKEWPFGDQIDDPNIGELRFIQKLLVVGGLSEALIVGRLVRKMRGARGMGFPDFLVPFANRFFSGIKI